MEQELNIAEILKDKPKGLKLWSPIIGDCELSFISSIFNIIVTVKSKIFYNGSAIYSMDFDSKGKYGGEFEGNTIERECVLFPSKFMRDWSKFAWKKGDVLKNKDGILCMFSNWYDSYEYTTFHARFMERTQSDPYLEKDKVNRTECWDKVTDANVITGYISKIEKTNGGKLNLDTLKIEKPQFKDGDIVTEYSNSPFVTIFIFKKFGEYWEKTLSFYSYLQEGSFRTTTGWIDIRKKFKFRLATDSEKQQLFSALEKDEKAWDAEKKQIVDLPKKCEFKPMDWCLMRFRGTNKDVWKLCQFGFIDGKDKNDLGYCAIGGNWFDECIPYNDQTAHLLGTTDDWEGDEE